MFWKYFLFEIKLLLHNRKNIFLGVLLLLYFTIFFAFYTQPQEVSKHKQKKLEVEMIGSVFTQFPENQRETPEGEEVYQSYLKQSTLVNFQVFYLWSGNEYEKYIENGLQLSKLRLRVHELNNKGIPEHLIISKEEILKENALLLYLQEHKLPVESDSLVLHDFFLLAFITISGLPFYFFVLLNGSEILVFEQRHRTVVNDFPISFMKKINIKISVYFIHIFSTLIFGFILSGIIASRGSGIGNLLQPVLIYSDGGFEAIPIYRYFMLVFLSLALITLMVLYLSALLNIFFKNAYATLIVGLGVFLMPDLVRLMGIKFTWLNPIKYVEFTNVLSGTSAIQLENLQIEYWHSIIWLVLLILMMISFIYIKNKSTYMNQFYN